MSGSGGGSGTALSDPRWLAAGAGGLLAAVAALWAVRGLPLGGLTLWASPLPILLAGLGFGLGAAAGALAVASAAIALAASTLALLLFLAGFGLPAFLLLALGLRGGRIRPALPFALLGLWPAGVTLALSLALAGEPGGLEGAMRRTLEHSFAHSGLEVPEEAIEVAARLKPGMLGLVFAVAMAANAALAQRLLARAGLALAPTPRWSVAARLPGWYPALPALAFLWWAAAGSEGVGLGIALALLVPLFLQGLAAIHAALPAGRPGRRAMLGALYAAILFPMTSTLAVLGVTAFGLFAQWWRHPGGSAAGPPGSSGGTPT
ncbi:hypothetical protein GCM10010964_40210 [Caldovatus sediminis]|uniref:DUF2232 domain-containing protein n=1 Tax=Caldovatus sediminis TaxID=2041189 RepID=A0A8J2ZEY7_9PROT|nr:hypothetical protein [Caldovatus sediminis]GGG48789.1 hypothetical protein GCM10010964_40210 [Caldovatus sediminis]